MNVGDMVTWFSKIGPVEVEYRGKLYHECVESACIIVRETEACPYQTVVPMSEIETNNTKTDADLSSALRQQKIDQEKIRTDAIHAAQEKEYAARPARVKSQRVIQRINGQSIVKDGVNYVVLDEQGIEWYRGPLKRCKQVAKDIATDA